MTFEEKILLEADAQSRISVWVANHADSPDISKIGDFSHNEILGGFISGDGRVYVSKDLSSVQIKQNSFSQTKPQIPSSVALPPALPVCGKLSAAVSLPSPLPVECPAPMLPALPSPVNPFVPVTTSPAMPSCVTSSVPADYSLVQADNTLSLIPKVEPFSPYMVPELLLKNDGLYNFIGICSSLGIDGMDYDKTEGVFTRQFSADKCVLLPDCSALPTYDHLGKLRMFVLFRMIVFDLKSFTFGDRPLVYQFRFKPNHPGVWFRDGVPVPGKSIILDTCILDVWNRFSPGNAGLIDAGDIAELDYKIFIGHPVLYVWRSDTLQSRNLFAKALHFLAEAKKHGVEASILKYKGFSQPNVTLDLAATHEQALTYGLSIPETLKDSGYVRILPPHVDSVPDTIPFFWSKGGSTLFFGSGWIVIMKKLLGAFSQTSIDSQDTAKTMHGAEKTGMRYGFFPRKQVAIFSSASTEALVNRLIGKRAFKITFINSSTLQKEDALETALLQNGVQVLFVYSDGLSEKDLATVLELCESMREPVVTAVFSSVAGEKNPSSEDVLNSMVLMVLVSQSYLVRADEDSVIVKDMATEICERCTFEEDGRVVVSEWIDTSDLEED